MPAPFDRPALRSYPRYDMRSNVGATSHLVFALVCIVIGAALIMIVLVASELRGSGSQFARHLAQAASIAQMVDPPRVPTSAMAQR